MSALELKTVAQSHQVLSRWPTSTWELLNKKRWKVVTSKSQLKWSDLRQIQCLEISLKDIQWLANQLLNQTHFRCLNNSQWHLSNKTQLTMPMLNNIKHNSSKLSHQWALHQVCSNSPWWEECHRCRTLCTGNNSKWVCQWCSNPWWEVWCPNSQWWGWLLSNLWWAACQVWCNHLKCQEWRLSLQTLLIQVWK